MTLVHDAPLHVAVSRDALGLRAECRPCGLYLEKHAHIATTEALRSLHACHPSSRLPHTARVPAGWRTAASGRNALSQ